MGNDKRRTNFKDEYRGTSSVEWEEYREKRRKSSKEYVGLCSLERVGCNE